jgi:hypothetical protein|tara:strand:+ start:64 stop:417 length:354 start_codon:yes stop_codon:yes gene_type:complete
MSLNINDISDHDFVYLENEKVDFYGIKLRTGKWRGVSYIYGKVSIKETPELNTATLGFTYNITDSGEFEQDDLINDPEFKNYLGRVLEYVISDSLENKKAKIGHIKPNTDSYTESSN